RRGLDERLRAPVAPVESSRDGNTLEALKPNHVPDRLPLHCTLRVISGEELVDQLDDRFHIDVFREHWVFADLRHRLREFLAMRERRLRLAGQIWNNIAKEEPEDVVLQHRRNRNWRVWRKLLQQIINVLLE